MIFEFEKNTIKDTVGLLIEASEQCRGLMAPKGVKHHIIFKLNDNNGNPVDEYHGSVQGWAKQISKDMYRIRSGSVESICSPHPRPW